MASQRNPRQQSKGRKVVWKSEPQVVITLPEEEDWDQDYKNQPPPPTYTLGVTPADQRRMSNAALCNICQPTSDPPAEVKEFRLARAPFVPRRDC